MKSNLCSRCGNIRPCSKPMKVWWKTVPLSIRLCVECGLIVCKQFLDGLIEGSDQQIEIDKLTKYNQR